MQHHSLRSGLSVFLTVLLIVSAVPASAVAESQQLATSQQGIAVQETTTDDGINPADEIYVKENGDAVLVLENETSDNESMGRFGVDVSSNLMHILVTTPIENASDTSGQASFSLTDTTFNGNGYVSFPQPSALSSFSMNLTGESTAENAATNLSVDTEINTTNIPSATLVESASTSGMITMTGSSFTADGEFTTQHSLSTISNESASYSLTETDGNYTVTVDRNRTVNNSSQWDSRDQAKATLEDQFQTTAEQYNGSAVVTIDNHSLINISDGDDRLDIAYTVQYDGLESAVADAVSDRLVNSSEVDLDQQRADELATQMENLSINRIATSYETGPETVTTNFSVDLDNYDSVVLAAVDIAEATNTSMQNVATVENGDRIRTQIEAQQASGLEQTFSWSGEFTNSSSDSMALSVDAGRTTTNWAAYVEELNSRGIDITEMSYQITGGTADERVNVSGSVTVEGNLLDQLTDQLANTTQNDSEANELLAAFLDGDLQRSRMDLSVDSGSVRFEAGAQFNNLSSFRDSLVESGAILSGVTSVVGRSENGTTSTYVNVTGAVTSGASESEIRSLDYVDSETTIYLPGEWDREFPAMDTDRVAEYVTNGTAATGEATFDIEPQSIAVNETVTFDAAASELNGSIVEYEWAFDDGTQEAVSSPVTDHTFSSAGTYNVTLTVTDENGATATVTRTVTVEAGLSINQAIDENGDGQVGDFEVLTAIEYWRTGDAIPDTGGQTIGDFKVLDLIELWRNNAQITNREG